MVDAWSREGDVYGTSLWNIIKKGTYERRRKREGMNDRSRGKHEWATGVAPHEIQIADLVLYGLLEKARDGYC